MFLSLWELNNSILLSSILFTFRSCMLLISVCLSTLDNDDGYQNERGYSYGSRGGYRNYGNYQGLPQLNINILLIA